MEQPGLAFRRPGFHCRRAKDGDRPIKRPRTWVFPNSHWGDLLLIIFGLIYRLLLQEEPGTGKNTFLERGEELEKSCHLLEFLGLLFNIFKLFGIHHHHVSLYFFHVEIRGKKRMGLVDSDSRSCIFRNLRGL